MGWTFQSGGGTMKSLTLNQVAINELSTKSIVLRLKSIEEIKTMDQLLRDHQRDMAALKAIENQLRQRLR